jgi:hypothetical protein
VAKVIGGNAYVHLDYFYELPDWAKRIIHRLDDVFDILELFRAPWNVVKVGGGENPSVSLLIYDEFETVDHPELLISARYSIDDSGVGPMVLQDKLTSFAGRKSPPILHRKELLVSDSHPEHWRWAALTKAEEEAGLLSRPDIGTKLAWERLLREKGYKVMFSCLVEHDYENDNA